MNNPALATPTPSSAPRPTNGTPVRPTAVTAPSTTAAPARAPLTSRVSNGVKPKPEFILLYGPPGIGKTSLAANAPDPIFLDLERGSAQLNVARVDDIQTWADLMASVRQLLTEPHTFRTLVIDTLDHAEWLCWQAICQKARVDNIADVGGGYGRGYAAALEQFREFLAVIVKIQVERGMRVIVLAHAKLETVKNPSGHDYQRHSLKVQDAVASEFVRQCDATLFAHYEIFVKKETGESRARVYGEGARYLYAIEQPGNVAKNRFGLPERIPLSWESLVEGIAHGHSPELLVASIREKIARLEKITGDAGITEKLNVAITKNASDPVKLVELSGRIEAQIAKVAEEHANETATAGESSTAAA